MSWSLYQHILELGSRIRFILVVDKNLIEIVWSLHEYCGTEVLAYIRRVKDPMIINNNGETTIVYYVLVPNPFRDIYIPRQSVSQSEVKVLEPLKIDSPYKYAVIHTHPKGVSRFSKTDKEYLNVNHVVSLLAENKQLKDASIQLASDNTSYQVRPEVQLVQPSLSIRYSLSFIKEVLRNPHELFSSDLDYGKMIVNTYLNSLKTKINNIILGCRNYRVARI